MSLDICFKELNLKHNVMLFTNPKCVCERSHNTEIYSTSLIINHLELDKMSLSHRNTHTHKIIFLLWRHKAVILCNVITELFITSWHYENPLVREIKKNYIDIIQIQKKFISETKYNLEAFKTDIFLLNYIFCSFKYCSFSEVSPSCKLEKR